VTEEVAVTIDPSPHIPLIHRVIGQMGLKGDLAEEAFSESLVTITEAAQSFDPDKGVPLANWLARNIRWGISHWLTKQRGEIPLEFLPEPPLAPESMRLELKEVLRRADKILAPKEKLILMAIALGYSGAEIAKELEMTPVRITVITQSIQKKLRRGE
jgi:RNA polymerase sigma factor (sigma-70 family)